MVKRHIDNSDLSKRLRNKGLPDYFLGIRYVGVKGAGERTHWVEPLAVPLVENIFKSVKLLTTDFRKHLAFLRSKDFLIIYQRQSVILPANSLNLILL
mgnify:CR=1 FL=1